MTTDNNSDNNSPPTSTPIVQLPEILGSLPTRSLSQMYIDNNDITYTNTDQNNIIDKPGRTRPDTTMDICSSTFM